MNSRFVIPKSHSDGGETANSAGETCLAGIFYSVLNDALKHAVQQQKS